MRIRTLIVDDEPLAREGLRSQLASMEDVDVVGEFGSASEVRGALARLEADLLFLDVQMPRMTGLRLLEVMDPEPLPLVVFVTAHDAFAVEAFDTRAVDYLLKPVHPARLARSMARVREQLAAMRGAAPANDAPLEPLPPGTERTLSRLMCKDGERVVFVRVEDIRWIESAGNYVVVHTASDRHIVRETMSALEQGLPRNRFVRINRSLIVNLDSVVELRAQGQGDYVAVLLGGRKASVTVGLRDLEHRLRYG